MSEFGDDKIWAYDNFPIKGFCTLMEKNLSTRIDGARHLTMYKNQGETDLKVRFIGDEGVYPEDDAKITWEVSEGGDKVIQLEPLNGGAQAHVTQIGTEVSMSHARSAASVQPLFSLTVQDSALFLLKSMKTLMLFIPAKRLRRRYW